MREENRDSSKCVWSELRVCVELYIGTGIVWVMCVRSVFLYVHIVYRQYHRRTYFIVCTVY